MADNQDDSATSEFWEKRLKEERELEEYRRAKEKEQAEHWAECIRIKEELIRPPFTRDIVKRAVHHFGSEHRPWLPYGHLDYDLTLVAERESHGYLLADPESEWQENGRRTDGPYGGAYDLLVGGSFGLIGADLPIGSLMFIDGDCPGSDALYVKVEPHVALTFVQVLLDHEGCGIRIVLEDEWLRQKRAAEGEE